MLNNYDKNFFANNNNKMIQKIININGKENDKLIHKSTEKYLIPFTRNDKKRYDKIIADKENKENKENKDNNISYFEHYNEKEKDRLIKKNKTYMEKIVNKDFIKEGINNNEKCNNHKKEKSKKEEKMDLIKEENDK